MGEAKRRGTREERIARAKARPDFAQRAMPASFDRMLQIQQKAERLFVGLTTPTTVNDQVAEFTKTLSDKVPIFLDCRPEPWARQSCCDMNVGRFVAEHGGAMLCGYRIWYNEPLYIEGERHAVWTDGSEIRDVSFADSGESRVLFVPDIHGFESAPAKIRYAFRTDDKSALADYEAILAQVPIHKFTPEEAWKEMPSYEEWLSGKRMPNMISVIEP